jgi:hypothetical protein
MELLEEEAVHVMLCIVIVGDTNSSQRSEASLHTAPPLKKRRRHAESHPTSRELLAQAQVIPIIPLLCCTSAPL